MVMRNLVYPHTCLITGSGGFIGKHLKEHLHQKYELLCPRSQELDLTDEVHVNKYLSEYTIDTIIHCATKGGVYGVTDSPSVETENLLMVRSILKSKNKNTRVIVFGSGAMYDRLRTLHKVSESDLFKHIPNDGYGKSKMEIAKLALERDDVLCLNIFSCYGINEKQSRFPTYAITQTLNSETVHIKDNRIFDYIYIDDLCRIIEYFINNFPKDKIINVTPTKSISMTEIAEMASKLCEKEVKIMVEKDGYEYTGDNQLLLKYIPDFKFTEYKDGMTKLLSAIKANI